MAIDQGRCPRERVGVAIQAVFVLNSSWNRHVKTTYPKVLPTTTPERKVNQAIGRVGRGTLYHLLHLLVLFQQLIDLDRLDPGPVGDDHRRGDESNGPWNPGLFGSISRHSM